MRNRQLQTQSSPGVSAEAIGRSSRFAWLAHPSVRAAWLIGHGSAIGMLAVLFLSVATERVYPTSVQLSISATVLKKVWARAAGAPVALQLAQADIARGYVDVTQPTVIFVRNNSDDGFLVSVEADPTLVSRLSVSGLPQGAAEMGPSGGFLTQPGYFKQEQRFELHWRLYLSQDAKAGPHPWPVMVHVQAN